MATCSLHPFLVEEKKPREREIHNSKLPSSARLSIHKKQKYIQATRFAKPDGARPKQDPSTQIPVPEILVAMCIWSVLHCSPSHPVREILILQLGHIGCT